MAKVFHVRAPRTMVLSTMDDKEIQRLVEAEAVRILAQFPEQARPVGVNIVSVSQLPQGVGGWAEWTRACCGQRDLIDEYVDPSPEELELAGRPYRPQVTHIETNFTVQTPTNPVMHGGPTGSSGRNTP